MIVDQQDFEFLFSWLELGGLLERDRFAAFSTEEVSAILGTAIRIAEAELAPHLRASDLREPRMDENGGVAVLPEVARAVATIAEAGLFGSVFDERHGGLQLPHLVHAALLGSLMAGNLATASFMLLTVGNAQLLSTYANEAQVAAFAEPQIAGAAAGTMCLSESQAGSSLGDITTRAMPEGRDELGERFRLHGNKMWISGGDHDVTGNIVHLVLAKVPDEQGRLPAGTRGISLFVVPKVLPDGQRNDVVVAGLNHKMGYRGIPNTALNFGEGAHAPNGSPGAIGWLVGTAGEGLPQMFHMMNEARIGVGLAGAMLACRGYRMSLGYARERRQGRNKGVGGGPQVPIIEHADVRRMLLAQKAISQGATSLVFYSARLVDEEKTADSEEARGAAARRLALLTPVTKTWPSEWAQLSLHYALQIFGGAGYTRDFEIEQLFRDNRLNPIHEGTTGIQGLDLVGRKIRRDGGEAFSGLAGDIRATVERARGHPMLNGAASQLGRALTVTEQAVGTLIGEADEARALAHGTPFLFAFGHLVVGWLWLDQAMMAGDMANQRTERFPDAFLEGRIAACRFFAETELPKVSGWLEPILSRSELVLAMPVEQF